MKQIAKFTIGSHYFFDGMKNFSPKDKDVLIIVDHWFPKNTNVLNFKDKNGNDVFLYKNMDKNEFIEDTLNSNVPMRCGKFLVKEFSEYIGLTIDDLKKLDTMFQQFQENDPKHLYEKYIYQYYIENGNFEMTQEQLQKVFEIYKKR